LLEIKVTDKSVRYFGSVSIAADLMEATGIAP
jgi:aspartate 1-decarboxylase